ncbi:MAG: hypothetical protein IJU76_05710 [Desulfovibrionaceae bacterium]|nr:hypothetical protein [Desulfovibrionaceae bacterium]
MRRLFQMNGQFFSDELPTRVCLDALDTLRFRDFLKKFYQRDIPATAQELQKLLENLNLATNDGRLNLAGVLLFSEHPEWIVPQFDVKAIRYPGNSIHATCYLDTEDFCGSLQTVFYGSFSFVMRNLHTVQAGQSVNAQGQPEVPPAVFEELLVNALVHRDYLINAPIRLFIFDDRIEILSPGHLPNTLTVEKIRNGMATLRNPTLATFVAKGLLPYHGLGTGIQRVLQLWPHVDFFDDRDMCLFTVIVRRPPFPV